MRTIVLFGALLIASLSFMMGGNFMSDDHPIEVDLDQPVKKERLIKRKIASQGPFQKDSVPTNDSRKAPDYVVRENSLEDRTSEPAEESVMAPAEEALRFDEKSKTYRSTGDFDSSSRRSEDFSSSHSPSSGKSGGSVNAPVTRPPGVGLVMSMGNIPFAPAKPATNNSNPTTAGPTAPAVGAAISPPSASPSNPTAAPVCSANLASGTYKNPANVNLICSAGSSIKYCLQQGGGCCDPVVSGTSYNGAIPVGDDVDSYCLSFYATASGVSSAVTQSYYVFNPDSPHLSASHPQTYYQTTELKGSSFITSTDFSNSEFVVGQINTRHVDPGVGGHNLTCEQLVDSYTTLIPAPIEIIIPTSMSNFLVTDQIEAYLNLPKIFYGDNFITSFAAHVNYVERVACSTTKIVLQDFEYFDSSPSFADAGTNQVREFSGSLNAYGFFEDNSTIYRGPAGEDFESQSGQKLETGIFAIFH